MFDQLNEDGPLYMYILRRHREIDFVLINSADPDKMPAFHLGHLGLQRYSFMGF